MNSSQLEEPGLHSFGLSHGTDANELIALRTGYVNRMLQGDDSPQKQGQRDAVAEFLQQHHHPERHMRLLSLPGGTWAFENQLARARVGKRTVFVAVERNATILEAGLRHMPGKNILHLIEDTKYGSVQLWRSTQATIFHTWFSSLAQLPGSSQGYRAAKCTKKRWRKEYKSFSAVWIDCPSQICHEHAVGLPRLDSLCDADIGTVPVAISYLVGREKTQVTALIDQHGSHAKAVIALLNLTNFGSYELVGVHEYVSGPGSKIQTALTIRRAAKKRG